MQLSNTALSLFIECPHCFYLDRKLDKKRPRGIFSSMPNAIDLLLKNSLDNFRGTLPKIFQRKELEGFLLFNDAVVLKKARHWKSNPYNYKHKMGDVVGAFDDMLFNASKSMYVIVDYKTKGSAPDQEYCDRYYQQQADLYTLFLQKKSLKHPGFAVLLYFWPIASSDGDQIKFETGVFLVEADPARAEKIITDAFTCLELKQAPPPALNCEFCKYSGRSKA